MTFARLKFLSRALISLALIALVVRKVDWPEVAAALRQLDLRWAALGWILSLVLIAGLAWRWGIFLRQQKVQLPFGTILTLTWAGQFFNSCLPGSTGGDIVKIFHLCRLMPHRRAAAASTVITDRASALLALLLLAIVAFALDPAPLGFLPVGDSAAKVVAACAVIAIGAWWLLWRTFPPARWPARVHRIFAALRSAFTPSRELAQAFLLALAIHVLNFLIIYFFARALEIRISFPQVLLMMPVILFVMMIPVTINGHGLREFMLIGYFSSLGITSEGTAGITVPGMALGLSLVMVANDLLWALPGGIFYLLWFRAPQRQNHLAEDAQTPEAL